MTRKGSGSGIGCRMLVWMLAGTLMAAIPCAAQVTVQFGETEDISDEIYDYVDVYGTLNVYPGAWVLAGINANNDSVVNVYGGALGSGAALVISEDATVTFYGTDFGLSGASGAELDDPADPTTILITGTSGGSGTVTWTYEGNDYSMYFQSQANIGLGGPASGEPVADAGEDVTIYAVDESVTVIGGKAADATEYRWLLGTTPLLDWTAVTTDINNAPLDLSTLSEPLGIGTHTLTLEVTDSVATSSDEMVLSVLASLEIESVVANVTDPVPEGTEVTVTTTFTGHADEAVIDWGDETETVAVTSPLAVSHTYSTAGVYAVKVTLSNDDGQSDSETYQYVVVYDPSSGAYVTGMGLIPEEGVPCGGTFFGFFCRQWGPYASGRVGVSWGDKRFRAWDIDWLTYDESGTAWLGGVGTINGMGEHYFILTITDAPDSIEIDIWPDGDVEGYYTATGDLAYGQIRIYTHDW